MIALLSATGIVAAPADHALIYQLPMSANDSAEARIEEQLKKEAVEKNIQNIRSYVRNYYSETPLLAKIAFCESTYRHFNENGDVLRGNVDSADLGVMQINERYHGKRAKELGVDIHSLDGNLRYAKLLYNDQGAQPWSASRPCWSKPIPQLAQQ